MKPRARLVASLKAVCPTGWVFINSERNIDRFSRTTVLVRQRSIVRAAEAPQGAHMVAFVVTIIDPATALDAAETALDDEVDDLLHAIDSDKHCRWTEARKVLHDNAHLAYEVDLQLFSGKE